MAQDGPAQELASAVPSSHSGRFELVSELADRVAEDEDLEEEIRRDPVRALHRHAAQTSDRRSSAWLMIILGALAAGVIVTVAAFAFVGRGDKVPPELIALGSAALGGLVGSRLKT